MEKKLSEKEEEKLGKKERSIGKIKDKDGKGRKKSACLTQYLSEAIWKYGISLHYCRGT